jgi:transcriptional regulator with XRE-family HTH domain
LNKHRGGDALAFVRDLVDANPEARREYERLGPRYELIAKIIQARKAQGLTQAELAERMNVSRPAVSRLESGQHEPRFDLIQRAADALGQPLVVEFKPASLRSKSLSSKAARTGTKAPKRAVNKASFEGSARGSAAPATRRGLR